MLTTARASLPDAAFTTGRSRAHGGARVDPSALALAGICGLIVVGPFEALSPVASFAGQSLSSVEVALALALAAWVFSLLWSRTRPVWHTSLTAPWLAVVAAAAISATFAPEHQPNAFRMVARLGASFAIYLMTINAVTSERRLLTVLGAACAAGVVLWPLFVLEDGGFAFMSPLLAAFKTHTVDVGGYVRASGPFQYPTIASMYLEIVFAFTLGLFLLALYRRLQGRSLVIGLLLVALGQEIGATLSRAGWVAVATALFIIGALRWRHHRADLGVKALAAVGAVIVLQIPFSRSFEALGLRLATEGQQAWHRASFDVPQHVTMTAGEVASLPVRVTNAGRSAWDPAAQPRTRLSYHWLLEDDRVVSWQGLRTDFPRTVEPGDTVRVDVRVEPPMRPGSFRLMWDIERENWLWFSSEPDAAMFVTNVTVVGPERGPLGTVTEVALPQAPHRPGRLELWRAALGMFKAHPLTGVGPDNFRLTYGKFAGLANADTRVHSNNTYIEMLAGTGLVGSIAFGWLCWAIAAAVRRVLRTASGEVMTIAGAAIVAAIAVIALHALVDSFLGFTATYVLFAITFGLLASAMRIDEAHAHRV